MIRTTRPTSSDKYYITKSKGGYSTCIKGKPTDSQCDVLANCVGYACGAANEELALGYEKYHLNCNAENFIERAIAAGLTVTKDPVVGAIGVWEGKGSLAGHVAICTKIHNASSVDFAQSGYGSSKPFWVATHSNANGRWGLSSNYPFRGFIIIPGYEPKPKPAITPTVPRDTTVDQLITNMEMNVRLGIETTSESLGVVPKGSIYNYYDVKQGRASKWYAITPDKSQWIAGVNNNGTKYCDIKPKEQPTPTPTPEPPKPTGLKVGDKVQIIGTGNGSSYGDSNTAYGIGWTRVILKIWGNRPYPYQVGNNTGTTGFYKENALKKL